MSVLIMNKLDIKEKIKNKFNNIKDVEFFDLNIAVASPSRKAIEHNYFKMTFSEDQKIKSYFIKNLLSETEELINFETINNNYNQINIGHTPELFKTIPEFKTIIINFLEGYKTANLKNILKEENLIKIIKIKKEFKNHTSLNNSLSVFNCIDAYFSYIQKNSFSNKINLSLYLNNYKFIKSKFENIDKDIYPCHVDNTVSNFMINDTNQIKFVDLDFCSNVDPLADLGSFAAEVCLFKNEINKLIEEYFGFFNQNLANRCFIYSILDDLRWALFSLIFNNISSRKNVEFMKYANWRFLSFNQKILSYDIGEILENI